MLGIKVVVGVLDHKRILMTFDLGLVGESILLFQQQIFFPNDSLLRAVWNGKLTCYHTNQIIWVAMISINIGLGVFKEVRTHHL